MLPIRVIPSTTKTLQDLFPDSSLQHKVSIVEGLVWSSEVPISSTPETVFSVHIQTD